MINAVKPILSLLLLIFCLLSPGNKLFGQEKFNICTGFGIPEVINVGLRYQIKQSQIGLSVGTRPDYESLGYFSLSGDFFYHIGGNSKFSERRLWYLRIGINYTQFEISTSIFKLTYLPIRIGRDINFSKKFGMAIDLGVIPKLNEKEVRSGIKPGFLIKEIDDSIFPAFGVTLFYRL